MVASAEYELTVEPMLRVAHRGPFAHNCTQSQSLRPDMVESTSTLPFVPVYTGVGDGDGVGVGVGVGVGRPSGSSDVFVHEKVIIKNAVTMMRDMCRVIIEKRSVQKSECIYVSALQHGAMVLCGRLLL